MGWSSEGFRKISFGDQKDTACRRWLRICTEPCSLERVGLVFLLRWVMRLFTWTFSPARYFQKVFLWGFFVINILTAYAWRYQNRNAPDSLWKNCKCFLHNYDEESALLSLYNINDLCMACQFYVLFSCLQNSLSMAFLAVIADYFQQPSSHKKKWIIKTFYVSITGSLVGNILPLIDAVPEKRCFKALASLITTKPSDNKKADTIQSKAIESNLLAHEGRGGDVDQQAKYKNRGEKISEGILGYQTMV